MSRPPRRWLRRWPRRLGKLSGLAGGLLSSGEDAAESALASSAVDEAAGSAADGSAVEGAAPGDTATAEAGGDATDGTTAGSGSGDGGGGDGTTCGGESFTAGTLVLLASGKAAPISALKAGDKVMAADTKSGKDQAETVTAVLARRDTDLYDLNVKTAHGEEVIRTTAGHLFYDPDRKQWRPASKLTKGEHLQTPTAPSLSPTAVSPPRSTTGGCGT